MPPGLEVHLTGIHPHRGVGHGVQCDAGHGELPLAAGKTQGRDTVVGVPGQELANGFVVEVE